MTTITRNDIPKEYTYCFAGKGICPQADTCLRAIAATLLTESQETKPHTLRTVSPVFVNHAPNLSSCPYYRNNTPVRFAVGMTRLFDELPLKLAHVVRLRVMGCFSCESLFYQCRKGTRPITPQEQKAIQNVFRSVGIDPAPEFDGYIEKTDW